MGSGARANTSPAPQARSVIVHLHPDAEEELYRAAEWYEERRLGLGVDLLTEVEFIVEILRESPLIWATWPGATELKPPVRRALLRKFPFAVAYQATPQDLVVLAIAHTSRRPFYWAHRTRGAEPG